MSRDSITRRGLPRTRKSLLIRLKNWHDEESWREFYSIYEKLIRETAFKSGLTDVEVQEVVQETLLTVAKKIAGFNYDPALGSFKNWLLQITRRRIIDQLRKRRSDSAGARTTAPSSVLDQLSDPAGSKFDALWDQEWHQALLGMAEALVRRKIGARQFRMFELYVLQQLPMKQVTRELGVNAAQVYMAKYRITRLLKKEIKQLEKEDW